MKQRPSAESFQPLAKPIVLVKRKLKQGAQVESHQHDWGQLLYAHLGVISIKTATATYICPAEQGVWLPPHVAHEVSVLIECELSSFYFEVKQISNLSNRSKVIAISPLLRMLIIEARNIAADYQWHSCEGRHLRLIRDFFAAADEVETHLPAPTSKKLLTITQQLQLEPSNSKSLQQWGQLVGASARTLSRHFKKETGLSYAEWRQRFKVQIAIHRLHQGESVSTVALQLGYESPSSFIYMFKQNTGTTPMSFIHR